MQASRVSALMATVAIGWFVFAVQAAATQRWAPAVANFGFGAVMLLMRAWVRQRGPAGHTHGSLATVGLTAGGLFAVALLSGGVSSTAAWFLAAVPLLATFLLGQRHGFIWALGSAGVVMVLAAMDAAGVVPPGAADAGLIDATLSRLLLLGTLLAIGVLADRATQETLDALHAQEGDLYQQRTRIELQARDLRKARDEALEGARTKTQFLANMSHEIRTPLNGIIGMTGVLLDTQLNGEQRDIIRTVERSGQSLLTIVDDILDLTKVEAGRVELEATPFDLHQCVHDVVALLTRTAREKDIHLRAELDQGVPRYVQGDVHRLRQVLMNLVGNAVKFTPEGDVSIHVRPEPGARNQLHFEVRDTGIGIPHDKRDRLFRPFSQVDASTSRRFGGTGLGLAISHRLTELMGGKMWVESSPGVGSTFYFTVAAAAVPAHLVPRVLHEEEVAPAGTMPPSKFEHDLGTRLPLRILIAEDNPINQEVAVRTLQRLGYQPDVVENGRECLDALGKRHYDLILMDMQMPVMSGPEATRRIRADLKVEDQPLIIALTANVLPDQRAICRAAGMDDFVGKPIQVEQLIRAIRRTAGSRVKEQPAAVSATSRPPTAAPTSSPPAALPSRPPTGPGVRGPTATRPRALDESQGPNSQAPPRRGASVPAVPARSRPPLPNRASAAPAGTATTDPLEQLRQLCSNDPGAFARLVRDHIINAQTLIGRIHSALNAGNLEAAAIAAHSLRGTAGSFGSTRVAEMAGQIEQLAQQGRAREALQAFGQLMSAWFSSEARLGKVIREAGGNPTQLR